MSQRPSASRPASRSPPEGQRFVLPPVQLRDEIRQEGRQGEGPRSEPESRGPSQAQETPPRHGQPLPTPGTGENWQGGRQTRDLGVHSILNPTEPDNNENLFRRISGTAIESPISAIGRSPYGASPSTTPSHTFPSQPILQSMGPRRVLTPRSPSARIVSAARGAPGTIDAHQSPFLPSRGRAYVAEPGPSASSDIPPMPNTGQMQYQQHYGFPPAPNPATAPRRSSVGIMQAPGRTSLSQSASPSISASSHNPLSSQTSPASFIAHNGGNQPLQTHFGSPTFRSAAHAGGGMQAQGHSELPPRQYNTQIQGTSFHSSSAGSSRQTSASDPVQIMTITTAEGSFNVPVDVHQASRSADEKRSRNAGASARFRKRRKEKEIEAHSSIERFEQRTREWEQRIREAEQERDRYREERDRLRDLVLRNPEMSHLAMQGPPSPRSMQSGSFSDMRQGSQQQQQQHPPPLQPQQPDPQTGFYGPETQSDRATRRRRTGTQGDFTSLPYPLPPASTLTPGLGPGFHGPPAPSGPPSLPLLRMEQPPGPQSPGSNVTPSTSVAPPPLYDPYARGPYGRDWAGDAGRR
ncbi:hypothetical protein WAI453_005257 [Rhynchosporium graminicola]